jgi:hypothetical protein
MVYFPKRTPGPDDTISDYMGYLGDLVYAPGNWLIERYWTHDLGKFFETQCPDHHSWIALILSITLWLVAAGLWNLQGARMR